MTAVAAMLPNDAVANAVAQLEQSLSDLAASTALEAALAAAVQQSPYALLRCDASGNVMARNAVAVAAGLEVVPDPEMVLACVRDGRRVPVRATLVTRTSGPLSVWLVGAVPCAAAGGPCTSVVLAFAEIAADPSAGRYIAALERAESSQRFLSTVSATLAATLEYDRTLEAATRLPLGLLADGCVLDLIDDSGHVVRSEIASVDPDLTARFRAMRTTYPPDSSVHPQFDVVRSGISRIDPVMTPGLKDAMALSATHRELIESLAIESRLLVPLFVRGRAIGTIGLFRLAERPAFDVGDLAVAEEFARRAAAAVDNALLYREAGQAIARLRDLLTIAEVGLQGVSVDEIVGLVVTRIRAIFGVDIAAVLLIDEADPEMIVVRAAEGLGEEFAPGQRIPLGATIAGLVLATGEARVIEEFARDEDEPPIVRAGVHSLMALPIRLGEMNHGAIYAGTYERRQFNEQEVLLLKLVVSRVATALDRARLFEAERKARSDAESANRTKDEFLATVSHELRTPLNAILGWSSLLKTRREDRALVDRAIEIIVRNAKAQAQLVEDILDVSRIITGKLRLEMRAVDLSQVVHAAIDTVRPVAEAKGVAMDYQLAQSLVPVLGDPDRLQQVVWNLLSNAIKFTPVGGRVLLSARRRDERIELSVEDTGQGMAPEFVPHVFERFRQADSSTTRAQGGLGLGLAIVRHLVELHGGKVHATSDGVGRGATFTVALPIPAVQISPVPVTSGGSLPAAPPSLVPVAIGDETLRGIRVLVVDDHADARELLRTVLVQEGALVETCSSAASALATLGRFAPDVLVADIAMPDVDGYGLIRRIRAAEKIGDRRLPAIAVTAFARAEDGARALAAGFQMHLPKPVDPRRLVAEIHALAVAPSVSA